LQQTKAERSGLQPHLCIFCRDCEKKEKHSVSIQVKLSKKDEIFRKSKRHPKSTSPSPLQKNKQINKKKTNQKPINKTKNKKETYKRSHINICSPAIAHRHAHTEKQKKIDDSKTSKKRKQEELSKELLQTQDADLRPLVSSMGCGRKK
jgi:hypothetical protein